MAEEGSADLESGPMGSMEQSQELGSMESGQIDDMQEVIPHATGMELGPVNSTEQKQNMSEASGMESGMKSGAQGLELESDPMGQEELESDPSLSVRGGRYEALLEGCVPVTLDPVGVLCLALHSLMLDSGFLGEEVSISNWTTTCDTGARVTVIQKNIFDSLSGTTLKPARNEYRGHSQSDSVKGKRIAMIQGPNPSLRHLQYESWN